MRVLVRLAADGADRGCSSPPTGSRRSTASSPACPTRARCSTSSPHGGSRAPPTSSPTTSIAVPDPNVLDRPRDARRCRSRSSSAARSPASRRRRCGSVRRRAPARSTATSSPTACGRTRCCPTPIVTPTTKAGGSGVHDEPLTCAEVVERGLVERRPLGAGDRRRPSSCSPRASEVAAEAGLILADTKYEFGVDGRRRAAADRRGAHARLVALLGRRHLRAAARRRRGAGEPRQGGRAPSARRRWVPRRRRAPRARRRRGRRDDRPLHRRLRAPHRHSRSSPATTRCSERIADRLDEILATRAVHRDPVLDVTAVDDDSPARSAACSALSTPHGDGRRPAGLLRPVRPAAPRPGGGRHRGQRRHAACACTRTVRAGLQRLHPRALAPLTGYHAIGHTRYSTTGAQHRRNIQPFLVETMHGPLAARPQRQHRQHAEPARGAAGARLRAHRHERHRGDDADARRRRRAAPGRTASSARCRRGRAPTRSCSLGGDRVLAVRDPWGFRPLSRRPPAPRRLRRRQRDVRARHARLRRHQRGRSPARSSRCRAPRCTAARR